MPRCGVADLHLPLLLVLLLGGMAQGDPQGETQEGCCTVGEACWPTPQELNSLARYLSQSDPLRFDLNSAGDEPRHFPSANGSPGALWESGGSVKGLYVEGEGDTQGTCLLDNFSEFCQISLRDAPHDGWRPKIVVFPTSAREVQRVVRFAKRHNICVAVAGASHDFLNRHSVQHGMLIRTIFLKDIDFDLDDSKRNFGHREGNVKVGAGILFEELFHAMKDMDKIVTAGHCSTVGIVGWTLGGGKGPFSPLHGLGSDNLLSADVVLSNGKMVTVSEAQHSDLFFALRGGGGSTWGVVVSLTVKMFNAPRGGFTIGSVSWSGDMCDVTNAHGVIDKWSEWSTRLSGRWSGNLRVGPTKAGSEHCGGTYTISAEYVYLGSATDAEYTVLWEDFTGHSVQGRTLNPPVNVRYWWDWVKASRFTQSNSDLLPLNNFLNPNFPVPIFNPQYAGGVPSVFVPREKVANGDLSKKIKETLQKCMFSTHCDLNVITHRLTGNIGSPQLPGTAVSSGHRTAMVEAVMIDPTPWYDLSPHSYFGESAYYLDGWRSRYWDPSTYGKLVSIKQKYDPHNFFWCRHCVGSDLPRRVRGRDDDDDGDDGYATY